MRPIDICSRLGPERIAAICQELNSGQLKSTLKKGNLNTKVPSRVVSQRAKRKIWAERVLRSLEQENEQVADSLLYEWLLHHRRPMLIEYLDAIGVKHQGGETEETFTKTVPPETLRAKALALAEKRSPEEVAAYVLYLDHHQESRVFTDDPAIVRLLGAPSEASESES
jgi:hypothetical protein